MHTHLHCQYIQTLFSIAPCTMHGVLMCCNQSLGVALSAEGEYIVIALDPIDIRAGYAFCGHFYLQLCC